MIDNKTGITGQIWKYSSLESEKPFFILDFNSFANTVWDYETRIEALAPLLEHKSIDRTEKRHFTDHCYRLDIE